MKIQRINDHWKDKLISLGFFISVFVYLEFALHILIYGSAEPRIVYPILFAFAVGQRYT